MQRVTELLSVGAVCLCLAVGCGGMEEPTDVEGASYAATKGSAGGKIIRRHTDTFTKGMNVGGWQIIGPRFDEIASTGGNPGAFLRDMGASAAAPYMSTEGSSVFTGDYTATGDLTLGVDLILFHWAWPMVDTIHLGLRHKSGVAVYADTGVLSPTVRDGWKSYKVEVPAGSSNGLPRGWIAYKPGYIVTGPEADAIWRTVIKDVKTVSWGWGAPLSTNHINYVYSGMDNATIDH